MFPSYSRTISSSKYGIDKLNDSNSESFSDQTLKLDNSCSPEDDKVFTSNRELKEEDQFINCKTQEPHALKHQKSLINESP
jgi:hypothetical protein